MNTDLGRKLESVIRSLAHCEANPDPTAGFGAITAQLKGGRDRAQTLATQQRQGLLDVHAATIRRRKVRGNIHHNMLVPLSRIAQSAAGEEPEVDKLFRLPLSNIRGQVWRTAARAFASVASEKKDLFLRHGMTDAMLTDLTSALDEYDAASDRQNAGKRAHVGATADLEAIMRDNMRLVDLLDGLNRYRFRDDAEKLAAWESARNLPTPTPDDGETPEAPLASAA